MPASPTDWIIDLSRPGLDGLLESLTTRIYNGAPHRFERNQNAQRRLRLVQPSATPGTLWDTPVLTGAVVEIIIGQADVAPTGGKVDFSYDGDDTGLTGIDLPLNDAGAFETLLNANPAISAAGGVTVSMIGTMLIVRFEEDGARVPLVADGEAITPPSVVTITECQAGDSDTPSIQTIELAQQPYGYVRIEGGGITATHATGTISFFGLPMRAAFAATTAESISARVSVRVTWPDAEPDTVYRGTALLFRDMLQAGAEPAALFGPEDVTKRGRTTIASAASSKTITFATAFASGVVPVVICGALEKAASGDDNLFVVAVRSVTNTGFIADFNAPTPNANYRLPWLALRP